MQLVTKYGEDTSISRHLELFDWFIVPVVNVDGYVYTWTHVSKPTAMIVAKARSRPIDVGHHL